jgi:hypothetical protein
MACHTTRGGVAYAGGRALQTPFGKVLSPNITADRETGIGSWTADDFWRALHNGKSKDGRLLYPAFPYTNYTKVRREDSDALYAYFQSVPPHRQSNQPHALRFPTTSRSPWPPGAPCISSRACTSRQGKKAWNGTAAPTWCRAWATAAPAIAAAAPGRQRRRPVGRPDSRAGLVCPVADVGRGSGPGRLGHGAYRGIAANRRLAPRHRLRPHGRSGAAKPAAHGDRRRASHGRLPEEPARPAQAVKRPPRDTSERAKQQLAWGRNCMRRSAPAATRTMARACRPATRRWPATAR